MNFWLLITKTCNQIYTVSLITWSPGFSSLYYLIPSFWIQLFFFFFFFGCCLYSFVFYILFFFFVSSTRISISTPLERKLHENRELVSVRHQCWNGGCHILGALMHIYICPHTHLQPGIMIQFCKFVSRNDWLLFSSPPPPNIQHLIIWRLEFQR